MSLLKKIKGRKKINGEKIWTKRFEEEKNPKISFFLFNNDDS